ncbi:hypothetical protein ACQ4PT_046351 [Festuca glaucescens]
MEGKREKKNMVEELLQAKGGSFSEEQMVDFCLSLLVAGYETTSVLMTVAIQFLTETPAALAQLTVNLEYLDSVVFNIGGILYHYSFVGTDSHTTMIDGLGIVGWGVGGIEAEATILCQG